MPPLPVEPITIVPMRDISALLQPLPGRRQPLAGFDDDYVDFVDYIVRCTHRIWEQKKVDLIYSHYSTDCVIHTLAGETRGAEAVVQGTVRTLAAFPDRAPVADDVIWSGDDTQGFYSSHRITSHMTNLGDSEFGSATGRRATVMTIADCAAKANLIYEEWLVRDNLSLVLQLGLDPFAIAQAAAQRLRAAPGEYAAWYREQIERVAGASPLAQITTALQRCGDPVALLCTTFAAIWNERNFAAVRDIYSPLAELHASSGRELFGHGEIIGYYAYWLAGLPDARVTLDHLCVVDRDGGIDVAIRWALAGRHTGSGLLSEPRGEQVLILGVTHWRVVAGRIVEEWSVFDELAVLRQMLGPL